MNAPGFYLSGRDLQRLIGVHPDLVRVVERAATLAPAPFMVLEGLRALARHRQYFRAGKTRTMRSRHLTGHAVDLAPLIDTDGDGDREVSWDWADFRPLARAVKLAAEQVGVPVEWGGDWKGFPDGPHWQLPWEVYP